MRGSALLHLGAEIDSEIEEIFNRWSDAHSRTDLEHPGFLAVQRFARNSDWVGQGVSMPCLTIYELEDLAALTSKAYVEHDQTLPDEFRGRLRYRRSVFREVEGSGRLGGEVDVPEPAALFHVVTEVESGFEDEFDRWYAGEHVPAVLTAPGVIGVRRFVQVEDPAGKGAAPLRHTCLAIYELEEPGTLTRPEAVEAAQTAVCPAELDRHRSVVHCIYEPVFAAKRD
jgi:hypothetical protein